MSENDLDLWLVARELLKPEMKTKRCKTSRSGRFCCRVCQEGQKTLFCSYSRLLTKIDQRQSAERPIGYSRSLYLSRHTVTVDLFANTCDTSGRSALCSELVRDTLLSNVSQILMLT